MAFVVTKSDGSTLTIVSTNSVDTTTSPIALHGRGKLRWGNAINENFVHMLENFADGSPPSQPLEGQLWAQKTGSPPTVTSIKFYQGGSPEWVELLTTSGALSGFVNETGDTMTGDLILDTANLNVSTGDITVSNGSVTVSSDGSPTGSPRTTALYVDGNIEANDSIMTFTDEDGNDSLIINQNKGATGTGPTIHVPDDVGSSGSMLLGAYTSISLNLGTSGGNGNFDIRRGGTTHNDTQLFQVNGAGSVGVVSTYGSLNLGNLNDTDKPTRINFYSYGAGSPGTFDTAIIRTMGENGGLTIANNGTGNIGIVADNGGANNTFTIGGVSGFTFSGSGNINAGTRRITGVSTPTVGTDAVNKSYVDGIATGFSSGQTWQNVSGSRAYGGSYQNTTGAPIAVHVAGIGGFGGTEIILYADTSTPATAHIISRFFLDEESTNYMTVSGIIPNNWYYRVTKTGSGDNTNELFWRELR